MYGSIRVQMGQCDPYGGPEVKKNDLEQVEQHNSVTRFLIGYAQGMCPIQRSTTTNTPNMIIEVFVNMVKTY